MEAQERLPSLEGHRRGKRHVPRLVPIPAQLLLRGCDQGWAACEHTEPPGKAKKGSGSSDLLRGRRGGEMIAAFGYLEGNTNQKWGSEAAATWLACRRQDRTSDHL